MQKLNKQEATEAAKGNTPLLTTRTSDKNEETNHKESIIGIPKLMKPDDLDNDNSNDEVTIAVLVKPRETFLDYEDYVNRDNGETYHWQSSAQEGIRQPKPQIQGILCA